MSLEVALWIVLTAGISAADSGQATGAPPASLTLELRVFSGAEEVTRHSRVSVHRGGDRGDPIAQIAPSDRPIELTVPEGIYDAQAIHEQDGRVVDIRWANRLVVMRYPDEGGRHLEVVNFRNGYGALQVRMPDESRPDVAIFAAGRHDKPLAPPIHGPGYAIFIVPAGRYDVQARAGGRIAWHEGLDVPLDRTRFLLLSQPERTAR